MVRIIFESHGTTFDNEDKISSGWYDVALSPLGQKQAKELGERRKENFAAIFCSDLQRSYKTGEIAFAGGVTPIIKDQRLRECNYGKMTRYPSEEVEREKAYCIETPFLEGESYRDTAARMKDFLDDVKKKYDNQTILIIGHRATQYGLEHWINNIPLDKIVTAPWQWQPGWEYELRQ